MLWWGHCGTKRTAIWKLNISGIWGISKKMESLLLASSLLTCLTSSPTLKIQACQCWEATELSPAVIAVTTFSGSFRPRFSSSLIPQRFTWKRARNGALAALQRNGDTIKTFSELFKSYQSVCVVVIATECTGSVGRIHVSIKTLYGSIRTVVAAQIFCKVPGSSTCLWLGRRSH